jgi:hypothetical protein
MRTTTLLVLGFITVSINIFTMHSISAVAQTKSDSLEIQATALNYIEGFYTNNAQRMEKAIHSELAKRIILKDEQGIFSLKNTGSSELLASTKKFKRPDDKNSEPFKATVQILDISSDIASVKVTTNKLKFFDYMHLGKINGEWKIINVLWARIE